MRFEQMQKGGKKNRDNKVNYETETIYRKIA
jgi:hypothetical protein